MSVVLGVLASFFVALFGTGFYLAASEDEGSV